MINLDSASVINVLSAAYNRLKKKGISKYSDGKIDDIYKILAEFAEEIGTDGLLKAIISMYIPSAIASSKSIKKISFRIRKKFIINNILL